MNELSYDQLLKIEPNHPITCPLINPLKFCGDMCSMVYEVTLDYDPEELLVDLKPLLKGIEQLDSWANGIMDTVKSLPEDLIKKIPFNEDKIEELLSYNSTQELKEMKNMINALIETWQEAIKDREEVLENLKINKNEVESLEKDLLLISLTDKSLIEDKVGLINFYNEEVEENEDELKSIEHTFEKYTKPDFEKEVQDFSNFLEQVRSRNDDLRDEITSLKRSLITVAKIDLNLYMPTEFLDLNFPENDKSINIGVIFNSLENDFRNYKTNYFKAVKTIGERAKLTFLEKDHLMSLYGKKNKNETISEILDLLKQKGINKVRYYEDENQFLKDKFNFNEVLLNNKKINKLAV